jgi:hypothetical protein
VGSPLRLSCGSLRRSHRRSGGNLTLGLPGSSTEQPIPWFSRGSPPFRSFVPYGRRPEPPRRPGSTFQTTGLPLVFPRDPLPKRHRLWYRQQRPIPGSTTPGPWRHLATSTSDRNAVLCPWAQDGHRKPPNFRPVGSR